MTDDLLRQDVHVITVDWTATPDPPAHPRPLGHRPAGVMITDLEVRRIHHPYDGGADVILTSTEERDRLRERHADWLSKHPMGL